MFVITYIFLGSMIVKRNIEEAFKANLQKRSIDFVFDNRILIHTLLDIDKRSLS